MAELCRLIVGLILLTGGTLKARDVAGFQSAIQAYGIVRSRRWVVVWSFIVLAAEIIIGSAVVTRSLFPIAGIVALAMLGVFTSIIAISLIRGLSNLACGCMVLGQREMISWYICARNLALAFLLIPSVLGIPALPFVCVAGLMAGISMLGLRDRSRLITAERNGVVEFLKKDFVTPHHNK